MKVDTNFYDREGNILTGGELAWGPLFEDIDYRRVAEFKDERVRISTVWVGLDQNYGGDRPLIFETMIFAGPDVLPEFHEMKFLWGSEAEAQEGHDVLIHCYREGIDPEIPIRAVKEKYR
jgi:hypothetical protein